MNPRANLFSNLSVHSSLSKHMRLELTGRSDTSLCRSLSLSLAMSPARCTSDYSPSHSAGRRSTPFTSFSSRIPEYSSPRASIDRSSHMSQVITLRQRRTLADPLRSSSIQLLHFIYTFSVCSSFSRSVPAIIPFRLGMSIRLTTTLSRRRSSSPPTSAAFDL